MQVNLCFERQFINACATIRHQLIITKHIRHPTQAINHYLFKHFGFDIDREGYSVDSAHVSHTWPFELHYVGTIIHPGISDAVFTFQYDEIPYYVLWGMHPICIPCAGMSFSDVHHQVAGSAWLQQQDPIDIDESQLGDPTIPPTVMRRAAIVSLLAHVHMPWLQCRILEGLFLRRIQQYVAIVENEAVHDTFVIGTKLAPQTVAFPEAVAWRR